ncbi:MAG: tetratricopeptide repeat protein [Planctomycetota bacterium]|jgi:hypothetical protein
MSKRVFIHSPYSAWGYHTAMEATLAHALRERGAEVRFTLCDGLFRECDIFRRNTTGDASGHRPPNACSHCQALQSTHLATYALEWQWLGTWISRDRIARIEAWVAGLGAEELLDATWSGQPVGEWAKSSAFNQFRLSSIRLEDPEVVQVLRDCLVGTAVSWDALSSAFDEFQPEVVVTFNGRFFSHRVAVELAHQRGARLITHERGFRKSTALLRADGMIHELDLFDRIWSDWHDVPLELTEVRATSEMFHNRRYGKDLNWKSFSPPPGEADALRAKLRLDDRPIVACFTSSDDEWLTFPERREGAFPNSLDWIPATVEAARQSPELQWVIRLHPNLVNYGVNEQAMEQAARISRELPENCRLVMPTDDVSSYTLADIAACGVVYGTTLGVEMASRGKPVLAVSRGWYGRTEMVRAVETPEAYLPAVRAAVASPVSFRAALLAHRFMNRLYNEVAVEFPWVEEQAGGKGALTFATTGELAPGEDPHMDRICAFVVGDAPLQDPPAAGAAGTRSLVEERFLLRTYPWLAGAPDLPENPLNGALDQAASLMTASQPMEASRVLLQALEAASGCAEAWLQLGLALSALGQHDGALEALQQSVALDRGDGEAWAALVRTLRQLGDTATIREALELAAAAGAQHPVLDELAAELGQPAPAPAP